ncbi:sigma-70 family RNA polymerase sigma factor [Nitratireductor sp. GISD-1A_MAKvit]|uniref:RNA polymerase sigma factor n=1 Tax=Nitratireductor sp. GISD-1A_MAKvit TaxID=3234198 RepID=UPI003467BBAE
MNNKRTAQERPARLELTPATYRHLLKTAHRHASHLIEAEDLVQETLIAALTAGNRPCVESRAWLQGVMRNVAATKRRSAYRRTKRENAAQFVVPSDDSEIPTAFLASLPRSQRIVALLALGGHTRSEIRHLLRISDASLRQRIAGLRQRWRNAPPDAAPLPGKLLAGTLAFGTIRKSLLPLTGRNSAFLASHDPDGNLFAIGFSHPEAHKPGSCGNQEAEPKL